MNLLKFIALIAGIGLVAMTKISYTKRNGAQSTEPYTKKEQTTLYIGYALLAASLILVVLFN